ncbi:glycosyltransferase [Iningainema tapete]|uniref:Glycosyltransferase 2-like prokaryotic type domain-containing protein n=1 Tax=Iningainema tapete BLCC-T55 TaxID=2748662 RepID=A0A8J6XF25_9CYAN|nr:glycosyltransferase [Iningainema tapete]MBD2774444.1 hypothetical protein [Iningainema tapete BLCC-T55]
MKLLTRICTSYRQWNYIKKWIYQDKLFNEFTNWIILNDCPSDPLPYELKEVFQKRNIKFHEFTFNMGRCTARNYGVNISNTKYVEHIDGDDLPLNIDTKLLENNSVDLIFFKIPHHRIDTSGKILPVLDNQKNIFYEGNQINEFYSLLFPKWGENVVIRPAGTLWKRDVFLSLGGYDERFTGAEDAQLLWKAYLKEVSFKWEDCAKQSYLEETGQKLESEYLPIGYLKFWYFVKETCPASIKDEVQKKIKAAHRQLLWKYKADMKIRSPENLMFRIKESIKWILLEK